MGLPYQSSWIPRVNIPALAILLAVLLTTKTPLRGEFKLHDEAAKIPVRILSQDPLIMHIRDFVSQEEAAYLVGLAYIISVPLYLSAALNFNRNPFFKPSGIVDSQGVRKQSANRTSSTAYLPADDVVVQRIAARSAEFQGFRSYNKADLQLTRYYRGQQFKPHFDWYDQSETTTNNGNRITTFFVILEASCSECGTRFPNLHLNCEAKDSALNDIIDCGDTEGLTVRPIPGSATFWRNLHFDGAGDDRTLHAGLPPENGVKIGLNIWTNVETNIFGRIPSE